MESFSDLNISNSSGWFWHWKSECQGMRTGSLTTACRPFTPGTPFRVAESTCVHVTAQTNGAYSANLLEGSSKRHADGSRWYWPSHGPEASERQDYSWTDFSVELGGGTSGLLTKEPSFSVFGSMCVSHSVVTLKGPTLCHLSHFLLQIFLTQGSKPGLLHRKQTLYCLSHEGSPSGKHEGVENTSQNQELNRLYSHPICQHLLAEWLWSA